MTSSVFGLLIWASMQKAIGDALGFEHPNARADPVVRVMVERIKANFTFEAPAAERGDDDQVAQPMRRVDLRTAVLERENFDRWLYGHEQTEAQLWQHLEELLIAKIAVAGLDYSLNDSERKKLRLAGRGDIKRFLDDVEDRR